MDDQEVDFTEDDRLADGDSDNEAESPVIITPTLSGSPILEPQTDEPELPLQAPLSPVEINIQPAVKEEHFRIAVAPVEVRESKLHGKGLFANRDFLPGDTLVKCTGEWINGGRLGTDFRKLAAQELNYLLSVGPHAVYRMGSPEKFVNTQVLLGSGKPEGGGPGTGAQFELLEDSVVLTALKEIKKDEEITVRYGDMWNWHASHGYFRIPSVVG